VGNRSSAVTTQYRITIHDHDGSVIDERRVDCSDDEDAIKRTGAHAELREMRIWQGERLVALFTRQSGFAGLRQAESRLSQRLGG
jgi:hypothetical protein